jgi:nitroreductase
MSLLPVIQRRYSVRAYQARPVEAAKLKTILEAARLAPSARNVQEWRFVVVQDSAVRQKLVPAANNQAFVGEAPVVIVCCAIKTDYTMRCGHLAYPIDLAIAIEHMALQAVEEGLGTCWIGSFYEDQVKSILGIPDAIRVVELLTLGYPRDAAPTAPKNRLSLDEIVCQDRWRFST